MLHTYTPQPMSLPSMNFLHLTVSEIQPGQTISRRPPAHPDTMGENNTPTALKGCGVKSRNLKHFMQIIIFGYNKKIPPGLVFMKGLRLSQVLGLNPVLKLRLLSQLNFCLKTVFTKGDLAKSKIIK